MSQQGIVGRVMQLARANVNAMIDSAEDPQMMLDQLVRDYSAQSPRPSRRSPRPSRTSG